MSISERKKEIRRRQKRRANYAAMKLKLTKTRADAALKEKLAAKLRKLSPGADAIIRSWGLE